MGTSMEILMDSRSFPLLPWLVSAFVLSRLDYCNAVLFRPQQWHRSKECCTLRRVLSLISGHRDHVTPTLRELHWLPISQRTDYKLCLLVHKSSIGRTPAYIADMLTAAGDVPSLATLRAALNGDYIVPRTNSRIGDRAFFSRCCSSLESAAG